MIEDEAPGPMPTGPYARYVVRQPDWSSPGMVLQCGGETVGVFGDDRGVVGMIQDGDSLGTLMRMADEHRPQAPAAGEAGKAAWTPAEARLQAAGRTFAVLRRLDYNVWDRLAAPRRAGQHDGGSKGDTQRR